MIAAIRTTLDAPVALSQGHALTGKPTMTANLRHLAVTTAAAMFLLAGPARAEADWVAAAADYGVGVSEGNPIYDPEDSAICSGLWSAWADAIGRGKAVDGALGPEFTRAAASVAATDWMARTDEEDEDFAAAKFAQDTGDGQLQAALEGDAEKRRAYFFALGVCHPLTK